MAEPGTFSHEELLTVAPMIRAVFLIWLLSAFLLLLDLLLFIPLLGHLAHPGSSFGWKHFHNASVKLPLKKKILSPTITGLSKKGHLSTSLSVSLIPYRTWVSVERHTALPSPMREQCENRVHHTNSFLCPSL